MSDTSHENVTDARVLRAMAHPLRMKLLNTLMLIEPATATQLAVAVGDTPANCSWHLRQLEKYGYIEQAPGGTGRQRPWRIVVKSRSFDDDGASPEARRSSAALTDALLDYELTVLRDWDRTKEFETAEWRGAGNVFQSIMWITPEELAAIQSDLNELVMRHFNRWGDRSMRPAGSRPIRMLAWTVPAAPYDAAHTPDEGETNA